LSETLSEIFNIYIFSDNTSKWEKKEDKKLYTSEFQKFIIQDMEKINHTVFGFYAELKKQIIFKIGDIKIKNTGSICTSKKQTIKFVKELPINIQYNDTQIKTKGVCVLLEILLRKLDEDTYNGKKWFFDRVIRHNKDTLFIGKTKN